MVRRLVMLLVLCLPVLAYAAPMRYQLTLTGALDDGIYDHSVVANPQVAAFSSCHVCHQTVRSQQVALPGMAGVITLNNQSSPFYAVPLKINFYGDTDKVDTFPGPPSPFAPGSTGTASGYYLAEGHATLSPIQLAAPLRGIKQVAVGSYHSCAVNKRGAVLCWGSNDSGELGSSGPATAVPIAAPGLTSGVTSVAAGFNFNCAVTGGGGVKCWGRNADGELGNGLTTDSSAPVAVTGLSSNVLTLAAGNNHTCALKSDQSVWCWGHNPDGELGNASQVDSAVPVAVSGLGAGSGVRALAAGPFHTCALKRDGSVWCWGHNPDGELGNGVLVDASAPVAVTGLSGGSGVRSITAGQSASCALKSDQSVWCWGYNREGELGNDSGDSSAVPVAVSGMPSGSGVIAIAASGDYWGGNGTDHGYWHNGNDDAAGYATAFCALKADGSVWCWGGNFDGQLGNGSYDNSSAPVAVAGLPAEVVSLSGGVYNGTTCALTRASELWCWGFNEAGQLARSGPPETAARALSLPSPSSLVAASFDRSAGLFVSIDGQHHAIGIGSGWQAQATPALPGATPFSPTLPGGILADSATDAFTNTALFPVDSYDLKSAFTMTGFDLVSGTFPAGWPALNTPLPLAGGGQIQLNGLTPRSTGMGTFTATPLLPVRSFLVHGSIRGAPSQSTISAQGAITLDNGAIPFNAATDDFVLGFGPYTALLPPGSLAASESGALLFSGNVNGTYINLSLNPRGSSYEFQVSAQSANLSNASGTLDFPVDVQFYLGDNAAVGTLESGQDP